MLRAPIDLKPRQITGGPAASRSRPHLNDTTASYRRVQNLLRAVVLRAFAALQAGRHACSPLDRRFNVGAIALCVLSACGGVHQNTQPSESERHLFGSVTFEARHPTLQGASAEVQSRPARSVRLALVEIDGGAIVAESSTDDEGAFTIVGPGSGVELRIYAQVQNDEHDVAITRDPAGREPHFIVKQLPQTGESEVLVHAVDATGDAGAFHMLDTLLLGLQAAQSWSERRLPPLFAYWVRGGTREWSYYRGERPAGSGRFALELLGGEPGQQSISDTDEHDEAIILHELGHFVMDRLSGDSSTGGSHPRGVLVDPGLAWEEGRATWFALAVLGQPLYRDTIGVQPWGRLRVDEDLEAGAPEQRRGLGSETSVSRILWDLSDGQEWGDDTDNDGLSIGAPAVLRAMMAQSQEPGVFPSLPSFLGFLVQSNLVSRQSLTTMLQQTGEPVALLPVGDDPVWPSDLPLGVAVSGKIDGLTQPAPSGGRNLPATGFDAIDSYRIHIESPGMLSIHLSIAGTGTQRDHQDLDLQLLGARTQLLASATGETPRESVAQMVEPGWYVVRVKDGGAGNRADYSLIAQLETLGPP